jgi:hypothetical protein
LIAAQGRRPAFDARVAALLEHVELGESEILALWERSAADAA